MTNTKARLVFQIEYFKMVFLKLLASLNMDDSRRASHILFCNQLHHHLVDIFP